ncbi:hypothetical protein TIFTF001_016497 [Ficus carica]|uniref:Uncharacterized protein n=1 Tax=Ficus carica TaxID=3494 RepID=A0AA88A8Y9_FICCA|nr:hypothetical protein TIFTF001_016497 [Ficus carica]
MGHQTKEKEGKFKLKAKHDQLSKELPSQAGEAVTSELTARADQGASLSFSAHPLELLSSPRSSYTSAS